MQLTPSFLESVLFVVFCAIGVAALAVILAYTVYGEEKLED